MQSKPCRWKLKNTTNISHAILLSRCYSRHPIKYYKHNKLSSLFDWTVMEYYYAVKDEIISSIYVIKTLFTKAFFQKPSFWRTPTLFTKTLQQTIYWLEATEVLSSCLFIIVKIPWTTCCYRISYNGFIPNIIVTSILNIFAMIMLSACFNHIVDNTELPL